MSRTSTLAVLLSAASAYAQVFGGGAVGGNTTVGHFMSSSAEPVLFQQNIPLNDTSVSVETLASPGYIFLNVGGPNLPNASTGPQISDIYGNLIWSGNVDGWGASSGQFTVQTYRNKSVLTVFEGQIQLVGYSNGTYSLLDETYSVVATVVGGTRQGNMTYDADVHECTLTPEGTAITTSFVPRPYNLTEFGVDNGYILDSLIQEVDIETGKQVFTWSPLGKVPLTDSGTRPTAGQNSSSNPWDWAHINSAQKQSDGNYLISIRHLSRLFFVNGTNGDIIWSTGKTGGNFTIGEGANFEWQHDARFWNEDRTTLTVFDNGAARLGPNLVITNETTSRGLLLDVDYKNMSVSLTQAFHPYHPNVSTTSTGSVELLSNDNVLVGWGSNPYFDEYTRDGKVVWAVTIGDEGTNSYRTPQKLWRGMPKTSPSVALNGTEAYVSWNGATEVAWYEILGSTSAGWKHIVSAKKTGFETKLDVASNTSYDNFWLRAHDQKGAILGSANFTASSTEMSSRLR